VLVDRGPEVWDDRRIDAGDAWLPAIERAIAACDCALLVVSARFF
jgi:hypothetical protein